MRKLVFAVVALLVLSSPFLYYGSMNYYGFCQSQGRILSDDELIAGLVSERYLKFEFVSDYRLIQDAGIQESEFSHRLVYSSVAEFLKDNPDCCQVVAPRRGDYDYVKIKSWSFREPSFWLRITGFAHANIGVADNIPIMTKDGRKIDLRGYGSYWVNSCGRSVEPPEEYGAI